MRNAFGVVNVVTQNLPITQEDTEYDKKKWEILRLTPDRLDVKIITHNCNDGRRVTFVDKHCDNNNLDYVCSSSTINKTFVNSQKSEFLLNFRL